MARRRRKRETRPADQAGYNACISWQRVFVASEMDDRSLTVAIGGFLQDTRKVIDQAPPRTIKAARARLRQAWGHLSDDDLWFAAVCSLEARALAADDHRPDRLAEEGRVLCEALRAEYPIAPPGFDRCGHSATGAD